jgi:hypothetical protein
MNQKLQAAGDWRLALATVLPSGRGRVADGRGIVHA